ncbi:MAG: NAD-dependent epimerase/dehydratase family protein [Devosiaceae bacterium]|nr:NAD-dependent epimerase/dehydratase family protein [Devosiaceae bacterium MH13]
MADAEAPTARRALVTGSAGFIGYHVCERLLADGYEVTGLDSLNAYYDPTLKRARQARLLERAGFDVINARLEDEGVLMDTMAQLQPEVVVHLAAQAGVRYSIDNPRAYLESNLDGTFELLEAARAHPPKHLLMASSSSVYGASDALPYAEPTKTDAPLSLYAATKKSNEVVAHAYAHLFDLPITCFRFFTVYGPWGRPDMALFKFTDAILKGEPIDVYNEGRMRRDFTYVDDLVDCLARLIDRPPPQLSDGALAIPGDSLSAVAPHRVVNLGNSRTVELLAFIEAIEAATGRKTQMNLMPMQPGDVPATWADNSLVKALIGEVQSTDITEGVRRFVSWYREYYGIEASTEAMGSAAAAAG